MRRPRGIVISMSCVTLTTETSFETENTAARQVS